MTTPTRAPVLAVMLALALSHRAIADTVHLHSGGKLQGTVVEETKTHVVIDTKFGRQRIDLAKVARVEKGATPTEAIRAKWEALAPADADGRFALMVEARDQKLRNLAKELLADVLKVDPQHAGANQELGNVLYKGKYVTPSERAALVKSDRAEQMLDRGLVEHDGKYVTPEEKEKLDQGLVLHDGEWLTPDAAKTAEGMVLYKGEWIHQRDYHVIEVREELQETLGRRIEVLVTDHVVVYTDVDGLPPKLSKVLEKAWSLFVEQFELGEDLQWCGDKRADVFVFRSRFDYQKFVDYLGSEKGLGVEWAARARDVVSIYHQYGWGFISTYQANRGEADVAHHMVNQLAHLMLNSYRHEGTRLPPFFDDAFAALTEFDIMKRNLVFTRGMGRYERSVNPNELAFFEDGQWVEPLRDAMRTRSDTPLETVVRRDYGDMTQMDVGKGMALFMRWRQSETGKIKQFIDALRTHWPSDNPGPGTVPALRAIEAAFRDVEGADLPQVDEELRAYVMKAMKK